MWVLEPGPLRRRSRGQKPLRRLLKPFAMAMEAGRSKRGPCAVVGCTNPETSAGQWTWLPPAEALAQLECELREGAVCFCAKVGCRAAMRKVPTSRMRKLKETMLQGSANDPPAEQYKVSKVKEIWGVR